MALSEFETKRYERLISEYVESKRPAAHIRPELDFGYRIHGQSVEIFEIRPVWRGKPGEFMEHPVAKATYVKSRQIWRVYWQRADLKWHSYEPNAEVESLEDFIAVVDADEYCCFYG